MMDKLGKNTLGLYQTKAVKYLKDKNKSIDLLNRALQKANTHRGIRGEAWNKLQLLFSIFNDWIYGNYRQIPKRSLLMIILGIVYFVSPMDGIFDYIPFLGLVDDAAVAGFVISQVSVDLERYKLWKKHEESQKRSDCNEIKTYALPLE